MSHWRFLATAAIVAVSLALTWRNLTKGPGSRPFDKDEEILKKWLHGAVETKETSQMLFLNGGDFLSMHLAGTVVLFALWHDGI
jgi:hypothetical protein